MQNVKNTTMIRMLLLFQLVPVLVFAQTDKGKYIFTEDAVLMETTVVDECNFSWQKVELTYAGGGQKIDADKGRYANERIKTCKLKTNNANWMLGSTEVRFQDKNKNAHWLFVDNDKLNFHDWTFNKQYVLYIKVLHGPDRLMFLDDIVEKATSK